MESPDGTRHTSTDQGPQANSLRPKSAAEKTGAVPKVPKSVSTGTLSLMIPSGKSTNTLRKVCLQLTKGYIRAIACPELQSERQLLNK